MLIGRLDAAPKSATMLVHAAPCALLWPAAMIVWGPGFVSAKHKHHSVQLVMATKGGLRIRSGPNRQWVECLGALVKADADHEVHAAQSQVLIAFVDPQSDLGAALLETLQDDITPVADSKVASWRKQLGDPANLTSSHVELWVRRSLLRNRRVPVLHPKVRKVLQAIREDLGTSPRRLSLKRLAAVAGLSESHFMHVFTQSVGVPLRPYILWLRVQRACGELMRGATVTQAAYRAGFSDGAHLSRTVRRMMGTTPRDLVHRRPATRTAFAPDLPTSAPPAWKRAAIA